MGEPLLQARAIVKTLATTGAWMVRRKPEPRQILDQVDLMIEQGGCIGLVGESGSGRTTLARILAGLVRPDEGSVAWMDQDISGLKRAEWKHYRRAVQSIFQDPLASMNPRQTVRMMLEAPMCVLTDRNKKARALHIEEVLDRVELSTELLDRYPRQLSDVQLQRVALARALAAGPDLLILDERASARDVSTQAQRLSLLTRLRQELGLAYLLISDDLPIVERLCDQVAVLKMGCIVEQGSCEQVLNRPRDAYTRQLCAAVPRLPTE